MAWRGVAEAENTRAWLPSKGNPADLVRASYVRARLAAPAPQQEEEEEEEEEVERQNSHPRRGPLPKLEKMVRVT